MHGVCRLKNIILSVCLETMTITGLSAKKEKKQAMNAVRFVAQATRMWQ